MPHRAVTINDAMLQVGGLGQYLRAADAGWAVVLFLWLLVRTLVHCLSIRPRTLSGIWSGA